MVDEPKDSQNAEHSENAKQQTPPPVKSPNEKINRKGGKDSGAKHMKDEKERWPDRVQAVCAALLVLGTALYTYYAREQADATNKSLGAIREQFQKDQRPYISVLGFSLYDPKTKLPTEPIKGKPLFVAVNFKNVGKTPAVRIISHQHLLFGSNLVEFKVEDIDPSTNQGTSLDLGATMTTSAMSFKEPYAHETVSFTDSDLLVWDGTEPIVVFGRVTYRDLAGKLYCTPYMTNYLTPPGGGGAWTMIGDIFKRPDIHNSSELCPAGER